MTSAGEELPAVAGATNGWRLERQPDGRLNFIAADGNRHADVDIRRGFPLSAPEGGLAIVAASGVELAWLDSLAVVAGPGGQVHGGAGNELRAVSGHQHGDGGVLGHHDLL